MRLRRLSGTCQFGADDFIALANAGIYPSRWNILDGVNAEDAAELVSSSDLLILSGGHVPTQAAFFWEIALDVLLQDYPGVVIGISAGSMKVFLFGGGKSEQEVFDGWVAKYPTVVSMIGKLNMRTELNLMSHLDVMLSMDSANMHLASLVNIPVISVWGATHPYAGFMGWKQLPVNTVQLDLSCRPCSVYGQKPCWRGDYACLREIKPEQVIAKIEGIIN